MNRYQLAVRRANPKPPRGEVRFVAKDNLAYVQRCIAFCRKNRLTLLADNVPRGTLDRSVVEYARSNDMVIVVATVEEAMALSSAYSYRNVHGKASGATGPVIYYGKSPPAEGVRPAVWVRR